MNVPIRISAIDVELDEEERALFEGLKRSEIYEDDGAAMRDNGVSEDGRIFVSSDAGPLHRIPK